MKITIQLNIIVLILFAAVSISFAQTTIYVNASAGGGNGSSWADAYTSFQSALTAASSGDEIWVAKGTYKPSQDYGLGDESNARLYHFRMINGVAIYGGFAGSETAVSQRTDYGVGGANETILSGDIGTVSDNSDNCYHVFYHPNSLGLDATAILDGFTITLGNANDSFSPHRQGGGMYNDTSSPTIINAIFMSNTSNLVGGGIYCSSSSPIITNSLFGSNTSSSTGGGIYLSQSHPTITNTTVTLNHSTFGGGMILVNSSNPTFNNSIIWGNTAGTNGNQIRANSGTATLNYSCYANGANDVTVTGGTVTATNNNITSDPQFVDANNGDYRITGSSPAADAGDNSNNSQTFDIRGAGYSRKLNKTDGTAGTIDMGAYEYQFGDDPLPVELTSFTANVKGVNVALNWETATEVNNYGFEIEKSEFRSQDSEEKNNEWKKIGFVNGHGNSNSPKFYTFTDNSKLSGSYSYRLKQIDFDGKFEYSPVVEISLMKSLQFALEQNYPNPFNPTTKISFTIPSSGNDLSAFTTLKIYDILGREITALVNEKKSAGHYEIDFNASNLSSGIYFYTLSSGNFIQTKKMLVIK